MVKFESQMRESSALFKDQQRIHDISQRIAEQNDQILSLLLELNSQPQVPARLRYDLSDPAAVKKTARLDDVDHAALELRARRHKVSKGELLQPEYEQFEQALLDSADFAPQRSYAQLLQNAPLEANPPNETIDASGPLAGGFLTTKQEEQYLHSLDLFCSNQTDRPRSHALSNLGSKHAEKSVDREREFQLKNPVSVYNWLRKNQPQVFLQDPEHDKTKATASRKSKRESIAKAPKVEPDMYDDDGIALEPSTAKGKRKRDEDGGYRPKGGHARPAKRRKDDGGRRSKRASMDISAT